MRKKFVPVRSASCHLCLDKDGGIFFRYPEKIYSDKNSDSTLLFIKYYAHTEPKKELKAYSNTTITQSKFMEGSSGRVERIKSQSDSLSTSSVASSNEDYGVSTKGPKKKVCSSCGTRKTPYWRDGWESGIMLCNACGIRYQKYKKYCSECCTIARKDEKGKLHCPDCQLRL